MSNLQRLMVNGFTIIQVSHSEQNAAWGTRKVELIDGRITSDEKIITDLQETRN
jgi:ABC-type lipoprotein export system ATPase subunit